jgi:mono/diheme cytochrome c family protein
MASVFFLPILVLLLIFRTRSSRPFWCRGEALFLARTAIVALVTGTALPPALGAAPPAEGEASTLYRRYCQNCHGADGKGARGGAVKDLPDFTQPSWHQQRTDVQLVVTILEGKGSGMPSFSQRLGEAKAKALVAHLRAFAPDRPKAPAAGSPASARETDFDTRFRQLQKELDELKKQMKQLSAAEADREKPPPPMESRQNAGEDPEGPPSAAAARYKELCQRCHGADGRGKGEDDVPDFTRRAWHERHSDAQLLASILDGTEGGMPPFRRRLGDVEAKELVAHVRDFAAPGQTVPVRSPGNPGDKPPATVNGREREPWGKPPDARALQEAGRSGTGPLASFPPIRALFPAAALRGP